MSIKVEKITEPVMLAEGPHWDDRQQILFFVSIFEKTIHKYVPATGKHTKTIIDNNKQVSFIIPVEDAPNKFVVGLHRKILIIEWDGEEGSKVTVVKDLGELEPDKPSNYMNDGKVDPRGRLFTGTGGPKSENAEELVERFKGGIFRVDFKKGGKIEKVWDGITIPNGLAWDVKAKAMYYVDTMECKVRRYDYDVETGDISNLTYVFDLAKNGIEGYPDGITIDTDGNLWVAVFLSSCVFKIDPRTGEVLQKILIPVMQVTSVTFGGPNLDILFVTTASIEFKDQKKPPGGSIYTVTGLGVKGLPNVNFKYNFIACTAHYFEND